MNLFITKLDDWPTYARLAFLCIPLLMIFVGLMINFYIAGSRHFSVMCYSLRRSSLLADELRVSGKFSLRARCMVVAGMTSAVLWPSLFIRRGQLHSDDNSEFPHYLRRQMKAATLLMTIGAIWSVFGIVFVEM